MLVYGLLLGWILLGGWYLCEVRGSRRAQDLYLALSGAVLVLLATLRYGIGFDYFNYQNIFLDISRKSLEEIFSSYVYQEFLGYALFNKLVAVLGGNYLVLLLVINLFLTGTALWFIRRYSRMPWLGVFLYVTLQFFAHSMNLLRQSIAAAICLLGYEFLQRRQPVRFGLVVLAAFTVHRSAVFMVFFYLVANWKPGLRQWLGVGIPALVVYWFSAPLSRLVTQFVFTEYAGYLDTKYWQPLHWTYAIFPAVYFGLTALFSQELLERSPRNRLLVNSSFYTFLIYLFGTHHMLLERYSVFLFVYSMVLVPELVELFREEGKRFGGRARCLAAAGAVLLGLSYFAFAATRSTNGFHKVYPYVGLWDQAHQERVIQEMENPSQTGPDWQGGREDAQ